MTSTPFDKVPSCLHGHHHSEQRIWDIPEPKAVSRPVYPYPICHMLRLVYERGAKLQQLDKRAFSSPNDQARLLASIAGHPVRRLPRSSPCLAPRRTLKCRLYRPNGSATNASKVPVYPAGPVQGSLISTANPHRREAPLAAGPRCQPSASGTAPKCRRPQKKHKSPPFQTLTRGTAPPARRISIQTSHSCQSTRRSHYSVSEAVRMPRPQV